MEDFSHLPVMEPRVIVRTLLASCSECHARLVLEQPYLYATFGSVRDENFTVDEIACPNCNSVFGVKVQTHVDAWLVREGASKIDP